MRRWLGLVTWAACGEPGEWPSEIVEGQAPPPLGLSTAVVSGQLTLSVSGATAGSMIYFAGSVSGLGAGPCPPVLGGQCIGLRRPVLIGNRAAGPGGATSLTVTLPPGLTLAWTQAAMAAGPGSQVSNVSIVALGRTVADLGPGDLVITEVHNNPSAVSDSVGEWFEVYNPGLSSIDLQGLVVRDLDTDTFTVSALSVPARGLVVLGASADTAVNGGAPVDAAWSAFALGNGFDEIVLDAGGVVIDQIAWDAGATWPAVAGRSMSLDDSFVTAAGNDAGAAWCAESAPFGAGDGGTPGAVNPDCGAIGGVDRDQDGADGSVDCDDLDPRTRPGAPEVCDGVDNDCSGGLPAPEVDGDGDGLPDCDACHERGWRAAVSAITSPGDALTVISGLVAGQHCSSYGDARDDLFALLDNDGGEAECVYTGLRVAVPSGPPDPAIMNIEHSWPRSLGADMPPAECDLHHLFPSDTEANGKRANLPFGEVVSAITWAEGGSTLGETAAGAAAFEPRDAHKGNVARAMLYMHVRHGLALAPDQIGLFQAWHVQDPVDLVELRRTQIVEAWQGVANPFVVCPEAVGAL